MYHDRLDWWLESINWILNPIWFNKGHFLGKWKVIVNILILSTIKCIFPLRMLQLLDSILIVSSLKEVRVGGRVLLKGEVISCILEANWKIELMKWVLVGDAEESSYLRLCYRVIIKLPAKCRTPELKRAIPVADDKLQM